MDYQAFYARLFAPLEARLGPLDPDTLTSIVGFEIAVSSLTGKWKLGQNRATEDRAGIAAGLAAEGTGDSRRMIDLLDGPTGPIP